MSEQMKEEQDGNMGVPQCSPCVQDTKINVSSLKGRT